MSSWKRLFSLHSRKMMILNYWIMTSPCYSRTSWKKNMTKLHPWAWYHNLVNNTCLSNKSKPKKEKPINLVNSSKSTLITWLEKQKTLLEDYDKMSKFRSRSTIASRGKRTKKVAVNSTTMDTTNQEKAWANSPRPFSQSKVAKSRRWRPSESSKPNLIKLNRRSTRSKKRVFKLLIMIMNARKRTRSSNMTQSEGPSYFSNSKWGSQHENKIDRMLIWTRCEKSYRVLVTGTIMIKTKI